MEINIGKKYKKIKHGIYDVKSHIVVKIVYIDMNKSYPIVGFEILESNCFFEPIGKVAALGIENFKEDYTCEM